MVIRVRNLPGQKPWALGQARLTGPAGAPVTVLSVQMKQEPLAPGEGEHFDAGVAGDLYQLGVLMFEALTEHHPFDPKKLPAAELFAAIETLVPRPPHYLNPEVPEPPRSSKRSS